MSDALVQVYTAASATVMLELVVRVRPESRNGGGGGPQLGTAAQIGTGFGARNVPLSRQVIVKL